MDLMTKYHTLTQLRTKKIGLLLKDARMVARYTPEECASALGIPLVEYQDFENGTCAPSLPELEILAYTFKVPIVHFWGNQSLSDPKQASPELKKLVPLRNRIVQTRLRQAMQTEGLDSRELAKKTGIPDETLRNILESYSEISLPDLEVLCAALNIRLDDLTEQKGSMGEWHRIHQSVNRFNQLDPDLQDFVSKPVNHPFIHIAQKLSNLPVEKLRNLAESLLEITY